MKVHLIHIRTIRLFIMQQPASRTGMEEWITKIKHADWRYPGDIAKTFKSADLLGKGSNRVIFDVSGNHYRIICKYAFGEHQVHLFICWIGSHAAYDRLCKENKQYSIHLY